jgi:hypothetical protein
MKKIFLPLCMLAASIAVAQTDGISDPNKYRLEKMKWNNDSVFVYNGNVQFNRMNSFGLKTFSTGKDSILGRMPCIIPDLSKCNYNMPNLATTSQYKAIMLERYGSVTVVKPPVILNSKSSVNR